MTADAATIYRWDHTVNESTGLYQDTVNSLFIRASDYSGNPRNLTSVSGWLKIFGGYGNSLELKKLPYSTFPNEVFSVKIKSDSGVALVEVKFLDVFFNEISGYNVTVTATTTGSIASLPASSDVYCVRIESDQEFYITDMVFGNITPSFLGSSDLYLPVSSSSSWDIRNLMRVSDTDTLQTLTWTVSSAPSHGTLTIESATASSGSSYITPGGTILYRPTANYTGSDSFTVEVSDGIASATKTINVTIIEQPQITNMVNDTNVSGDFITSSNDITLIGSATANSTIEMFSGYISHGTTTANSSGYWEYRINPITEGSYSFICSSTLGGVTVFSEEAKTVVIDATAPVTSISNISFSNDSGNSSSDRITKTALQYLNIILDSSLADNEHVEISMDEGSTWTDVSIATGTTTGTCSVTLLNGTHTIKGRIADTAGNEGTVSSYSYTLDTTAPALTLYSSSSSHTNQSSIPVSVVFNEQVTGFDFSDISVINAGIGDFSTSDGITYTFNIYTSTSIQGDIIISLSENMAEDLAGNRNSNSSSIAFNYDAIAPAVNITSSAQATTNASVVPVTITFSETVTGFTADDIIVVNGTKGVLSGSGSVYTINITALAQGTVSVNVAAGVASDQAGNENTAASELLRTYDSISPTNTISLMQLNSDMGESNADFITNYIGQTLYISLLERLADGEHVEISMDNGMTWTNFRHAVGSYYGNDNITLIKGTHSIKLRIVDSAGNTGTITTQQYTLDTDIPTVNVTHSLSNPTNQTSIPITITFSEDVSGMQLSDILLENGTASSLSGSGSTYTAQIIPSGNGEVRLRIGYGSVLDLAGNTNETSSYYTWTYDGTSPSVTITSTTNSTTNLSVIPVTITFSEPVTGFTVEDVTVMNGIKGTLNGSGSVYTINITPLTQGTVNINIASGVVTDAAGNNNTAASELIRIYDSIKPTVAIHSATNSITNLSVIPVTITFSEPVTGFTVEDVIVTNGIKGTLNGSGSVYTINITPSEQGTVTVGISADAAYDLANNGNTEALALTRIYDSISPTVAIHSATNSTTNLSVIPVTITFSEPVTGFTVEDVTVMNGIKGTLNGSGSVYTINITPLTQGTVNINIASGVVTDAAGNNNTAASELIRIYDSIKPTVAIHSATNSITNLSVIPVTITFSEPVTGFTVEDVIVTNGIKGTLSGSGSVYMINITPSAQGTVTVGISADAAYDLANNGNTEALALTRIYDSINPTVAISSVTGNSTNVTPIPVTITFSEDVTGFTVNEITVINGVAGGFVSVSGSVYTAFITPAGNGEVIIDVLADTALDAALNPNNAAPSLTRVFDSERPTVIISSSISDYTYCSPITVTFAFSKNVTGFTLSDIIVNNGIASNLTAISNSTYTVDITSATQGNVTVDLPDGTAEDAAGNTNTAAVQFAYIYDNLAPVIATESVISVNATGTEFIRFSWDSANDNISSDSDLLYRAYYSMRDDISSIIDLLNNGTAINAWSSETSVMVSDLTSSTRYYFNVLVKDEAGNISLYNSISGTTDETITDEDIQLPNNTLITVNGEKKEAANIKRETTKGKTTITITIDDKLLKNLLDEKDEDVKVTLPAIGYTNEVVGQLNGQTIKNMERKNAVLEIKTDKASYSLPADQLNIDEISKVLDSQSNLEDIKVKINISEPDDDTVRIINDSANKDKLQLVVKPVEFTITCEANGKSMEISKFKGYVERRIAIPDGIDPAKISTAVVLNDDGTMSHVPTVIVQEGNKYYAVIKSLTNSIYTIVYKKAEIKDAEDHWAKTELNDMASRLVIQLDDEGRFFPDKKITRAQFAKLTVKALGLVPDSYKGIFSDVSDESEHSLYIEKAYEYGIIKGYGNGLFGPDDFLTREQATTIIERAMNLAGYNVVIEKVEIDMILDKFIDKSEISHYAVNSMAICIKNNIIIGRLNNEADPTADLTRAEAVVMLRRMLQNTGLINK